jgi:hypothetical protein
MAFNEKNSRMEKEMAQLKRKNEERLARTTKQLSEIQRDVHETEDIAVAILDDMGQQREQLLNTKRMVWETQDFSTHAQGILKNMQNTAFRKRLCLWLTILALIGAIGYVLWFGYITNVPPGQLPF